MADDWSRQEVEATVSDYFAMLHQELRGDEYDKTAHRNRLLPSLEDRSKGSVEFKHQNISAVLIALGFPYISGYKPRSNYQGLLFECVAERLAADRGLQALAEADARRAVTVPQVQHILKALTAPPRVLGSRRSTPPAPMHVMSRAVNYLQREAQNRILGAAGEKFIVKYEQARLIKLGYERLASRIEHVSKARGDSEGFDILSFETSGAERLIEVKTTGYGRETPFFVSRNEVSVSQARAQQYHLYRVFAFRQSPQFFFLKGALSSTCTLNPETYVATVA